MNKYFKKTFKILKWLLISLFVLIIGIVIFIQTDTFNNIALNYISDQLNEGLEEDSAKISAASLEGNIFSGLRLNEGAITLESDTIVKFNYLDIKYDIWGLLDRRILLDHVILNTPTVSISKIKDSGDSLIWNFSKLFTSTEQPDTASSPFDWDIAVEEFKIVNGNLKTSNEFDNSEDSIQTANLTRNGFDTFDSFDMDDIHITDFNLDISARYFNDLKSVRINNLSLKTNSNFNVNGLSFFAEINGNDNISQINNFELSTNRSLITATEIFLDDYNPFDSTTFENFKDKDLKVDLDVVNLNFRDLRYFIPELTELDSSVSLKLDAKGQYGAMDVSNLILKLGDSYLKLTGQVRNLDRPDSLYFDIASDSLNLFMKDITAVLKDPAVNEFTGIGHVNGSIAYSGSLDNFFTRFNLMTDGGDVEGSVNLDIIQENYSGKINTRRIDLGKILKSNDLKSNLNLFAEFNGNSFDLNRMSSQINYSLSNSTIAGYDTRFSQGKINFSRNNINLNIKHLSSIANILVSGSINIANMDNPKFNLKGRTSDLNISKLTDNAEDESDLNFTFDLQGSGMSLKNLNGNFNFDFSDSHFGEYNIPDTPLDIEIQNSRDQSSYSLSSEFADFYVRGTFDIENAGSVIAGNIQSITDHFSSKLLGSADSIDLNSFDYETYSLTSNENFNLSYNLTVKDTAALNLISRPFGIIADGRINGNVINTGNNFSMTSFIDLTNFIYQDTVVVLKNFNSDISVSNNYNPEQGVLSLSPLESDISLTADKASFQNTVFDSVKLDVKVNKSLADLTIYGTQDSSLSLYLQGQLDLSSEILSANFDSVKAVYQNIIVSNKDNWIINYTPGQKVNFEQVAVRSKGILININGDYEFNGNSDVVLSANDISLSEIYSIIYYGDKSNLAGEQVYPVRGNIDTMLITFKGSNENPELTADIAAGKLIYIEAEEEIEIGSLAANIIYKDEIAVTDIILGNAEGGGALVIKGDIPYRNPLSADTLVEKDLSGKSADLKLTSKDFQIEYFLKLLPSLPPIGGILNGEITATGDASAPELIGSMSIQDGNVYYALTGMDYKYKLNTSTEHSKLLIDNLSLSSSDDEARHFDIFGSIDFSQMKINDIDLNTRGDMVFLDESVTQNLIGVYGYLRAGSGSPNLKIKGDLDKLSITGQLLIVDATISSIPLEGSGYDNEVDDFTYVTVSDSANNYSKDTTFITEASDYYKINPFARYKYSFAENENKAADFLDLDISVKTQKSIYASIDFDNLTKDRLFGELTADLKLNTEGSEFNATGEVNILKNSYYRFYKDFELDDSKITFDGPVSNPILDIQAVYEGTKTTEQFGTVSSIPVNVRLTIKGKLDEPKIELSLIEDGNQISGNDAQQDAITFLLFGKYKSELSSSQRTAVASSLGTGIGSLYISSIVSRTVRDILPFLMDAKFKYSEGSVSDTEVELTSGLGDATVTVGGKLLKEIRNFEFVIEYPLNDFLNLNLPETLLLQLTREEENNIIFGSAETTTNTGLKILYKIKY